MTFSLNPFYNKSIRRLRQMIHAIRTRDFSLHFALDKLHGGGAIACRGNQ